MKKRIPIDIDLKFALRGCLRRTELSTTGIADTIGVDDILYDWVMLPLWKELEDD